ncbi:hypothetical protein NQ318_003251 [Aromia moschata]|uniref:Uncharacterized protein n=1 Tax=Aromia moschata TaxID=1265417 RepID=A0AAV8XQ13_9CUCU|nr:hypothetical protein NQ318_003251 [Aromia moschata]
MLSKTFKRIVTEGKGSKPFYCVRNLCVQENNEYLFANPNTKNKCLSEYHILKKLAQESDVQDTSLFHFNAFKKTDCDYSANFLKNIYQTAKVSKLLIAINSGKGSLYKGKNFDEIELSDINESDSEKENTDDDEMKEIIDSPISQNQICNNEKDYDADDNVIEEVPPQRNENLIVKKKIDRSNHLGVDNHIKNKKVPKKDETETFIERFKEIFKDRNWVTL